MNFIKHSRLHTVLAGFLAVVILALPLAGCAQTAAVPGSSLRTESSAVNNDPAPKIDPSGSVEASGQSAEKTDSAAGAKTSSETKQSQKTTTPKTQAAADGQTLKKTSGDALADNGVQFSVPKSFAAQSGYAYVDQREGYNFLPDLASRAVYKQIFESAYKISAATTSEGYYPTQKIVVSGSRLSEAQLRVILLAFLNDNPQVFWLANAYSYAYSNDSTYIQLYSVVSQPNCTAMIQKMNQKVSSVISAMPAGLSELDRELYLFHYIAQNCTYNNAAVSDTGIWQAFSSYGVLIDGTAVCEGYSRAMQLLSSYAGLQCMLLSGQSSGVNHMWNVIKIDGSWYHLDTTWGDGDTEVYNYFNLNDAAIAQSRTIFPSASTLTDDQIDGTAGGEAAKCNLAVPVCTATAANYFRAKAAKVSSSLEDSTVTAALTTAVQSKSPSVSFYIDEGVDFETIMAGMTTSPPYQLLKCVNAVNGRQAAGSRIDTDDLQYLGDKVNRGITLFLKYK
ncbi:transglutaminase domain-containing protein [Caproiciproducens sp.]